VISSIKLDTRITKNSKANDRTFYTVPIGNHNGMEKGAEPYRLLSVKRIRASNFKSFDKIEVELGPFNVLIGRNAAGKSNFVQVFKFLKDIASVGLESAITLQGDIEYLINKNVGTSKDLTIEVEFGVKAIPSVYYVSGPTNLSKSVNINSFVYEFSIKFAEDNISYKILKEKLIINWEIIVAPELENQEPKRWKLSDPLGVDSMNFLDRQKRKTVMTIEDGKASFNSDREEASKFVVSEQDFFSYVEHSKPNTLMLEWFKQHVFADVDFSIGTDIATYNFETKLLKRPSVTGKAILEEDGSNLALILRKILQDREKSRIFMNLLQDILPFVTKVDVKRYPNNSLLFGIRESYRPDTFFPSQLVSDGTVIISALIAALFFETNSIRIFEEPAREIHPFAISKVVSLMKDASRRRQVIMTTHNPEVVRHSGKDNLILISRNALGYSVVSRPSEKEEVINFLKNDLGIAELYVEDLLGF
jgi:predicted ATPase